MQSPEISVIIPSYNSAKFLPRSIGSVLNQTFQGFEIIIIDDASIDSTKDVVREFQKEDNRIKYKRLEENSGGAAKPKNEGIKISKGQYIAVLDADDEWFSSKLEKQLNIFKKPKKDNLGFVGCFAEHIYEDDGETFVHRFPEYKNVLRHILARDYMGSGSSLVYKREVFDKVGYFDENLRTGQDAEMRIRLAEEFGFDFVEEALFRYYFHKNNITNSLIIEERIKNIYKIIEKHKNLYESYPKSLSNRLRFNGTSYMMYNRTSKARDEFIKSIRINSFNLRSYLYLLISFLGSDVYKKLTLLKSKIK